MSSGLTVVVGLLPQVKYQDSYTSQIHNDLQLKIIWYLDPLGKGCGYERGRI